MILQVLIFSIPEAFAITWLTYALASGKFSFPKVTAISLLLATIVVIVRPFAGTYLVNVVACIITLVVLLSIFKVSSLWERLTSATLSASIYLLLEFLNIRVLSIITGADPGAVMEQGLLLPFLWFLPQLSAAMLIAFLLTRYKVTLFVDENQQV